MTDIEIRPASTLAIEASEVPHRTEWKLPTESFRRTFEQREQLARGLAIEDSPEPIVLHHGLRAAAEMAQISKAHPVDARRQAAFPATPDQPRHIKQEGSVVSQASGGMHEGL